MRRSLILTIAATLLSVALFAQTKKIAHKSHSGSKKSFTVNGQGNFGVIANHPEHRTAKKPDTAKVKVDTLKNKPAVKKAPPVIKPKIIKVNPRNTRKK